MNWIYDYAGLHIVSEIEIPEWRVFASEAKHESGDVSIFLKEAHEPDPNTLSSRFTSDEYEFCMPEAGRYRVRGGCEIFVTPWREAGAAEIRLFLLGAAWAALCYQRGFLLLHASVVHIGAEAIAFCGPAGAGKSSLVALLLAQGHSLVSDDLCRVDFLSDGMAVAYPSAPRLKLWRDALTHFQKDIEGLERDFFRLDKFQLPLPVERISAPVPLRALYLLEWGELRLTRLSGVKALQRLVQGATYRSDLLEPSDQVVEHWERMAELTRRVPVFELARPKAWEAMETVLKTFETLEYFRSADCNPHS